ncbi:MAG: hypothetical protein ABI887_17975 [Burkholderiales bacterium]
MTWPPRRIAALAVAASSAACSPALDWREFVPEGSELGMTFPCRTDRHARPVVLAGATVQMEMLVCTAGDTTWAVSFFDVADPARVSATLAEWRASAVANVQGVASRSVPLQIQGMTPNEQAVRVTVAGKLPDGVAVQEHAAFFVHGLRVYAATVIGAKPPPQAVEVFFGGLKFPA